MLEDGHAQQKARIRRRRRRMLRVEKGIFRGRFLCKHIHELKKRVKRSLLWGPTTPDTYTHAQGCDSSDYNTQFVLGRREAPDVCHVGNFSEGPATDCALLTTLEHFLFSVCRV